MLAYDPSPMPRPKKESTPPTDTDASPDAVERLVDAVERVSQELRVLRDVVDEVREEFVWAVRNDRFRCPPHIVHSVAQLLMWSVSVQIGDFRFISLRFTT